MSGGVNECVGEQFPINLYAAEDAALIQSVMVQTGGAYGQSLETPLFTEATEQEMPIVDYAADNVEADTADTDLQTDQHRTRRTRWTRTGIGVGSGLTIAFGFTAGANADVTPTPTPYQAPTPPATVSPTPTPYQVPTPPPTGTVTPTPTATYSETPTPIPTATPYNDIPPIVTITPVPTAVETPAPQPAVNCGDLKPAPAQVIVHGKVRKTEAVKATRAIPGPLCKKLIAAMQGDQFRARPYAGDSFPTSDSSYPMFYQCSPGVADYTLEGAKVKYNAQKGRAAINFVSGTFNKCDLMGKTVTKLSLQVGIKHGTTYTFKQKGAVVSYTNKRREAALAYLKGNKKMPYLKKQVVIAGLGNICTGGADKMIRVHMTTVFKGNPKEKFQSLSKAGFATKTKYSGVNGQIVYTGKAC